MLEYSDPEIQEPQPRLLRAEEKKGPGHSRCPPTMGQNCQRGGVAVSGEQIQPWLTKSKNQACQEPGANTSALEHKQISDLSC
ncbi:hypothetical protein MUG91_G371n4 [Manis pentadactyla]|nr:hypothetical protein MUG91_G371n4 [Manis pentadactyla]